MRQSLSDLTKLQLFFLRRNCKGSAKFDYTIIDYKARGQAFSKGGGNVTVPAFHITWSRALARLLAV
jgi:predicted oxidoreductase